MLLQLVHCEYDCGLCGTVHRYTEGVTYDLHRDLMTGNRRWVYVEVEETIDISIVPAHGIPQNSQTARSPLDET